MSVPDRERAVTAYLASLSDERAGIVRGLRKTILSDLPSGFVEVFAKGVFSYVVPRSTYPSTYNGQPLLLAAVAAQKSFVTLYLMAVYGDTTLEKWFKDAYARSGKRLDMGKSCVHFKRADEVPWGVIGQAIKKVSVQRYIRIYESGRQRGKRK